MRSRLLAVLGAVAMIVAAVAVRSAIDDPGGGGSSPGTGPGPGGGAVVCDRALADACPPSSRTDEAPDTAAQLLGAPADRAAPAWVTVGPWPQMVDETRKIRSQEPVFSRTTAIASTRLVAVVKKGRLACQPVTWKCIGDAVAAKTLTVAAPDARRSLGLLVRVAAVAGFLGGPPGSTADVTEDPGAMSWLGGLETAIADGRQRANTDLAGWISQFPASTDAFLTTEADATAIRGSRVASQVDVVVPEPAVVAQAVVGESGRGGFDSTGLRDRLAAAGWNTAPASGATGLPSPDVLYALGQVVR